MQSTDIKWAYQSAMEHQLNHAEAIAQKLHFRRLRHVANHQAYRARQAGTNDRFTAEELDRLFSQSEGVCPACGQRAKLTVDHIVPLSAGIERGRQSASHLRPM